MTRETYYLGAYWGARGASPEQIAEQFALTMRELRNCHPLLASWNETANTYAEALRLVVEPSADVIAPLLTTIEPDNPTKFGYDLRLWNGRPTETERCVLKSTGGMVPPFHGLGNNVILSLTRNPLTEPDLYSPEVLLRVMEIVVRIWRPDHARLMSNPYDTRYALAESGLPVPGQPRVGWMTYLRAQRLRKLPAEVPYRTVKVDDQGTIFVVTDEHRFTVDNPQDVSRAQSLAMFLEQHGALEIIPTNLPI